MIRFPKDPSDGYQLMDKFGMLWEYDASSLSWISKGYVDLYDIVNEEQDGIINPELYNKLSDLDPNDYIGLKLSDSNSYYYMLYSSDRLISFKYEIFNNSKRLKIEADRNAIIRRFYNQLIVGPKGERGEIGDKGLPGRPSSNEPRYSIKPNDKIFNIPETSVETPIDTFVSLRLFRNNMQIAQFVVDLNGNPAEIPVDLPDDFDPDIDVLIRPEPFTTVDGYSIDLDNTIITYNNNMVSGTIIFLEGDMSGSWDYRARQMGPIGDKGDDGAKFLEITTTDLRDDHITSDSALYNLVKIGSDIGILKIDIGDEICVNGIQLSDPAIIGFDVEKNRLLTMENTINECKKAYIYEFELPEIDPPSLDLPEWTPTDQCPSRSRWSTSNLDWISVHNDSTEEPDVVFPYKIIIDPPPESTQCCQDPFFWCPNVGDEPCGIEGVLEAVPEDEPEYPGGWEWPEPDTWDNNLSWGDEDFVWNSPLSGINFAL